MARADAFATGEEEANIALPPRLDITTVGETAAALRAQAGRAVVLDAGGVTHLGGAGLELLLLAARDHAAQGLGFAVTPRSDAFAAALTDFGVGADALSGGGAAWL